MNLKGLKKVHEDDHVALFRSKDGHECRISKKGLSEKLRKELADLPTYSAYGNDIGNKMGNTQEDYTSLPDRPMPEESTPFEPMQEQSTPEQQPWADPAGYNSLPDQQFAQQPPEPTENPEAPENPQPEQPAQNPAITPAATAQELTHPQESPGEQHYNEIQKYGADKANNLTPKTYSDLLFKDEKGKDKGFLGKMGALFGLMLSGAGSGLAHQQNMAMAMMDNEIAKDLEAQKQNQTNKLDYGKLVDNHIKTMADASKTTYDIWHLALQDEVTRDILKQSYARRDVLDDFYRKNVASVQEGTPERIKREQVFANMVNAANKEDVSAMSLINGRAALFKEQGIYGGPSTATQSSSGIKDSGDGVDYEKWNKLKARASQKLPFSPSEADLSAIAKEAVDVKEARQLRKVYIDSFNELNKMPAAGEYTERRKAYVNALGAKLATLTSHRYNRAEADAQAEGMFPSWKDLGGTGGKTREIKLKEGLKAIDSLESGTPMMDFYKLKTPPPNPPLEKKTSGTSSGSAGVIERVDPKNPKTIWLYDAKTKKPLGKKSGT